MKLSFPIKIVIAVLFCILLGGGSGFVGGSPLSDWYQNLNKPVFQPPSWVFGPAWTFLYTLMGISIALIWNMEPSPARKKAITLFFIQFIVNLIWTPIFFGVQNPTLALIVIIIMWIFILLTIKDFLKLKKTAGYLLIPYLVWVSFATVLNASIVYLN